jgi:hypothetical protein
MRTDWDTLPEEIQKHGFDFHWENEKVWALNVPIEEIEITELDWILELPFWKRGEKKYNLSPREVMQNLNQYIEHTNRIVNANVQYPIDIMKNQDGRWNILDGMHRMVKQILAGEKKVKVRKISRDFISMIEKNYEN